jgi:hypothetical protein
MEEEKEEIIQFWTGWRSTRYEYREDTSLYG